MTNIETIMRETGMGELQAYRHLQDRRKAQALYQVERRRARPVIDSEAANEALRLWQIARQAARNNNRIAARAYYRECISIIRGRG